MLGIQWAAIILVFFLLLSNLKDSFRSCIECLNKIFHLYTIWICLKWLENYHNLLISDHGDTVRHGLQSLLRNNVSGIHRPAQSHTKYGRDTLESLFRKGQGGCTWSLPQSNWLLNEHVSLLGWRNKAVITSHACNNHLRKIGPVHATVRLAPLDSFVSLKN